MNDFRRERPWSLWFFLATVLGVSVVTPGGRSPGPSATPTGEGRATTPAPPSAVDLDGPAEGRQLRPLRAFLDREGGPGRVGVDDLHEALYHRESIRRQGRTEARATPRAWDVQYLIACISDPIDTAQGYRFDLLLQALEEALKVDGFVIDRYYLPWQAYLNRAQAEKDPLPIDDRYYLEEPGLLLFRDARNLKDGDRERLLLVFLVGETPVFGIHKGAFATALGLVRTLSRCSCAEGPSCDPAASAALAASVALAASAAPVAADVGGRLASLPGPHPHVPLLVLGPTFSGSTESLLLAIKRGKQAMPGHDIKVYSGTAMNVSMDRFAELGASFDATAPPVELVRFELLRYVEERNLTPNPVVAWLTEANTGYGSFDWDADDRAPREEAEAGLTVIEFPFPMYIAGVRHAYELERADARSAGAAYRPERPRIDIPFDVPETARDLLPPMTPGMTSTEVDRLLSEILTTIRRWNIRYVGITATDPRDRIFLADLIRDSCPDTQLLIVSNDELYTHPDSNTDLRGALIGSNYPLFPKNQAWVPREDFEALRHLGSHDRKCLNVEYYALELAGDVLDEARRRIEDGDFAQDPDDPRDAYARWVALELLDRPEAADARPGLSDLPEHQPPCDGECKARLEALEKRLGAILDELIAHAPRDPEDSQFFRSAIAALHEQMMGDHRADDEDEHAYEFDLRPTPCGDDDCPLEVMRSEPAGEEGSVTGVMETRLKAIVEERARKSEGHPSRVRGGRRVHLTPPSDEYQGFFNAAMAARREAKRRELFDVLEDVDGDRRPCPACEALLEKRFLGMRLVGLAPLPGLPGDAGRAAPLDPRFDALLREFQSLTFLGYGVPFGERSTPKPPIWIGVVGRDGLWPIRFREYDEAREEYRESRRSGVGADVEDDPLVTTVWNYMYMPDDLYDLFTPVYGARRSRVDVTGPFGFSYNWICLSLVGMLAALGAGVVLCYFRPIDLGPARHFDRLLLRAEGTRGSYLVASVLPLWALLFGIDLLALIPVIAECAYDRDELLPGGFGWSHALLLVSWALGASYLVLAGVAYLGHKGVSRPREPAPEQGGRGLAWLAEDHPWFRRVAGYGSKVVAATGLMIVIAAPAVVYWTRAGGGADEVVPRSLWALALFASSWWAAGRLRLLISDLRAPVLPGMEGTRSGDLYWEFIRLALPLVPFGVICVLTVQAGLLTRFVIAALVFLTAMAVSIGLLAILFDRARVNRAGTVPPPGPSWAAAAGAQAVLVGAGALLLGGPGELAHGILLFERTAYLFNGVSLLVPGMLLSLALFAWGACQLKRLFLIDYGQVTPWPDSGPLPPGGPRDGGGDPSDEAARRWRWEEVGALAEIRDRIREVLVSPTRTFVRRAPHWLGLALLVALSWMVGLWTTSVPPFEHAYLSLVLWLGLVAFLLLWTHWVLQVVFLIRALTRLLRQLALLPLGPAFGRLPEGVASMLGRLLSGRRPRLPDLRVPVEALERIAAGYDRRRGALRDRWKDTLWEHRDDRGPRSRAAFLEGSERLAAALSPEVHGFRASSDSFLEVQEALAASAGRLWGGLVREWTSRSTSGSRAVGGGADEPDGPAEDWVRLVEEFVAIQVVYYLAWLFVHARNLLYSLLLGSLLMLMAVLSYPLQPHQLLVISTAIMVAAVAVVGVLTFVAMEGEPIIDRVAGKQSGVRFDLQFLSRAALFLGPLLLFLIGQAFPEVIDWVMTFTEPLRQRAS